MIWDPVEKKFFYGKFGINAHEGQVDGYKIVNPFDANTLMCESYSTTQKTRFLHHSKQKSNKF